MRMLTKTPNNSATNDEYAEYGQWEHQYRTEEAEASVLVLALDSMASPRFYAIT